MFEPIGLAFLLEDGRGRWWALVCIHNDPEHALVQSGARLLAREP